MQLAVVHDRVGQEHRHDRTNIGVIKDDGSRLPTEFEGAALEALPQRPPIRLPPTESR